MSVKRGAAFALLGLVQIDDCRIARHHRVEVDPRLAVRIVFHPLENQAKFAGRHAPVDELAQVRSDQFEPHLAESVLGLGETSLVERLFRARLHFLERQR
jgi:hypothetical protein